jgi:hypothetical protein
MTLYRHVLRTYLALAKGKLRGGTVLVSKTYRLHKSLLLAVDEYRQRADVTEAEAVRSLLKLGLEASKLDGFDIVKALVSMLTAQSEIRDRVSAIEADTRQSVEHLVELAAAAAEGSEHFAALRGWADDMEARHRPSMEMICELYMVGRLFTKKKWPEEFDRLFALGDQQLAIFEERVREMIGRKADPQGGSSSALGGSSSALQPAAGGAASRVQAAARAA